MANPNEVLINLYVENRRQFAKAITLSKGHAETILDSEEWCKVLFVLATNDIAVDAVYRGQPE